MTALHPVSSVMIVTATSILRARKAAGSCRPLTKTTEEPLVPIMFISMKNGSEAVMSKAQLDSGAGASLIIAKHCNKLKTAFKK
eukprot:1543343-Ditylum_brightwellii.AAC.1